MPIGIRIVRSQVFIAAGKSSFTTPTILTKVMGRLSKIKVWERGKEGENGATQSHSDGLATSQVQGV